MLLQLRIKNFAIIDDCLLTFEPGLVALTGETGAGKSIIVDALSAALGSRVGADVIRHSTESAEVEALFSNEGGATDLLLRDHGLEQGEDVVILTREIHRGGRSVGRVNGRPVAASTLTAIADSLVDLHGQSEHLSILKPSRQLRLLDHFGGLDESRKNFACAAAKLVDARQRLAKLQSGQREAAQRVDLLRFQVGEISSAKLRLDEPDELLEERRRLANAEKLAMLASVALSGLAGEDSGSSAIELLGSAAKAIAQLAEIDAALKGQLQTADDLRYQVEELAIGVRRYRDEVEFNPARLDEVEARLDEIGRLQRKYGPSVHDVLQFLDQAEQELEQLEDFDGSLQTLEAAMAEAADAASAAAKILRDERLEHAERFAALVGERLARLGLGPASFEIELGYVRSEDGIAMEINGEQIRCAFTAEGLDRIQFMVAFNAGEPLKPIEKVASGGETARFMLAVKSVLAEADDIPTMIFDEIDTGVGGRGGNVIGAMLKELAQSHQVISITHLAPIAALADEHLKVLKRNESGQTGVQVERLDRAGRVVELAEMLAGSGPSATVLDSAEEMLAAVGSNP